MHRAEVLIDGLQFPEGPRWRNGELWFADMFGQRFYRYRLAADRKPSVVAEIADDWPSGSGFLPDGTPLLTLRRARSIVKVAEGRLIPHLTMGAHPSATLNDLVVGPSGQAYVGNITREGTRDERDSIFLVDVDGKARVATYDVRCPNGMVIPPGGDELIVAETRHHTVVSFRINADGSLTRDRVISETIPGRPDGICGDVEGAVWVGCVQASEFVRVKPSGEITSRITVGKRLALACVLGGENRTTLFMMTAATTIKDVIENHARDSRGYIEVAEVAVPGAGVP
jgi:sugar lactone lactonase YvrE